MVIIQLRGISLSAGAVLNGAPAPVWTAPAPIRRGDFATRPAGRERSRDKRNKLARLRFFGAII